MIEREREREGRKKQSDRERERESTTHLHNVRCCANEHILAGNPGGNESAKRLDALHLGPRVHDNHLKRNSFAVRVQKRLKHTRRTTRIQNDSVTHKSVSFLPRKHENGVPASNFRLCVLGNRLICQLNSLVHKLINCFPQNLFRLFQQKHKKYKSASRFASCVCHCYFSITDFRTN